MRLFFLILCGMLYIIGFALFGWNYHETSVYVCLYWWPYICAISTLPISCCLIWRIVKNKKRVMSLYAMPCTLSYSWMMFGIAKHFIKHYEVHYGRDIDAMFYGCQNELKVIAQLCGTDYATVNVSIYVVLFLLIMAVNAGLIVLALPPLRKKGNRQ